MTKKRKRVRFTVSAYGEGETEGAFLRYLRSLYEHNRTFIKVTPGHGGGKKNLIKKAIITGEGFHKKFILLDEEGCSLSFQLRTLAKKNGLIVIESQPCIEGLFLSILDNKFNASKQTVKGCKKKFWKNYLNKNKALKQENLKKIFNKKILDKRRKDIKSLDSLIRIMKSK